MKKIITEEGIMMDLEDFINIRSSYFAIKYNGDIKYWKDTHRMFFYSLYNDNNPITRLTYGQHEMNIIKFDEDIIAVVNKVHKV